MKTHRKTPGNPKKIYKSNPLHFQIGLVVSLAAVYIALQLALPKMAFQSADVASLEEDNITYVEDIPVIKKEVPKREKKTKREKKRIIKPEIIYEPEGPELDKPFLTEPEPSTDLDLGKLKYIDEDPKIPEIPYEKVEFVPVFPGCETLATNEERKACMSEKINKLIRKKFKTRLAERYGLSGIQKIYTEFKINTKGEVTDIRVKSPHPVLEKEAERVLGLIPRMQPAKQHNIPVKVIYTKPIVFKVN